MANRLAATNDAQKVIVVGLSSFEKVLFPLQALLCHNMAMSPSEDIQQRITELEIEHRDLDTVIAELTNDLLHEELQLRRLKKRKLQLKDHITLLKMQLVPDIPA